MISSVYAPKSTFFAGDRATIGGGTGTWAAKDRDPDKNTPSRKTP